MFKFKFVCECCGWSKGEAHLPEVYDTCDECAEDGRFEFEEVLEDEFEVFEDEVARYYGLR